MSYAQYNLSDIGDDETIGGQEDEKGKQGLWSFFYTPPI